MRAGEDDDDDGEGGGKSGKDKMDKVGILEVVGNRLEEVEAERDRLKADLNKEREKSVELSEVVHAAVQTSQSTRLRQLH